MAREVIISCSYLLHSDKLDAGCEAALFEKQRERRAQAGTWIWGSRLRAIPQLQLCRSPGSPKKATCGAGYSAGALGDSLPCGNPRDAESLLSHSGPQMIQTRGWGFLWEGKREKSMPCQLQNSLKIESRPTLQAPDAIPQITQFQLHYYQLTTRQSFPVTLGEISHCP